jgi:hypothetical protein
MDVERERAADWPHWPDRGNCPPRRDRLERRLFRDSEREAEFARAEETLRRVEEAAREKAAQIERLEDAIGQLNGSEPSTPRRHLLFAWTPRGYTLHEGVGDVPGLGRRLSVDGRGYAVAKLARSPLPGDTRRCAYLDPL